MIKSMLDNDLYKFTMQQFVLHNFPQVEVEYELKIRSDVDLRPYKDEIAREIRNLDSLQLHPVEAQYMNGIRFLSDDYVEWLGNFRYNSDKHITIGETESNLSILISGRWLQTILYEVPILAIISEVYHSHKGYNLAECTRRLEEKIETIKSVKIPFTFADFGTRRRNSFFIQDHVVGMLAANVPDNFIGTSNVHLAMKYGLKATGTMAHEAIMNAQALYPLPTHQKDILYAWGKEFQGDLGYALSDTLGVDYFLKDFTLDLAKLFDGTRQDSGNPYTYGEKIIAHYEKLGINPKSKYVIFSDALNIDKAIALNDTFGHRIKTSFGIGTHLTNDCGDLPLSIVIKVQKCNGIPVVKLSDTPEKSMGRNHNYLEYIKDFVKGK